jgi:hypothetical protein
VQYYTDGPSPPALRPGILYLDRQQSLKDCVMTVWLLEAWLTPPESSPAPQVAPGERHATD